jgi:2-dehydropantoate 2-reductase
MKIAIVGAGGVGGYYGGLLAAAGNDVHFVARGAHLNAMREHGLHIQSLAGDISIQPVQATDRAADIGPVDVLIFCTKAFSTEAAAAQTVSIVTPDTTALSLENGVEGADQLGRILGMQHVLGAATWISSVLASPGVIRHLSEARRIVLGELDGSDSPRLRAVHRLFEQAGVVTESSSNILGVLWAKLAFISAVAGVGSLTRLPMAAYRDIPETRNLLIGIMHEAVSVAVARGIRLDSDVIASALTYIDHARPGVKPSMQLDVEAGRPFELDAQIGVIVRQGVEYGVPTPISSTIYSILLPLLAAAR